MTQQFSNRPGLVDGRAWEEVSRLARASSRQVIPSAPSRGAPPRDPGFTQPATSQNPWTIYQASDPNHPNPQSDWRTIRVTKGFIMSGVIVGTPIDGVLQVLPASQFIYSARNDDTSNDPTSYIVCPENSTTIVYAIGRRDVGRGGLVDQNSPEGLTIRADADDDDKMAWVSYPQQGPVSDSLIVPIGRIVVGSDEENSDASDASDGSDDSGDDEHHKFEITQGLFVNPTVDLSAMPNWTLYQSTKDYDDVDEDDAGRFLCHTGWVNQVFRPLNDDLGLDGDPQAFICADDGTANGGDSAFYVWITCDVVQTTGATQGFVSNVELFGSVGTPGILADPQGWDSYPFQLNSIDTTPPAKSFLLVGLLYYDSNGKQFKTVQSMRTNVSVVMAPFGPPIATDSGWAQQQRMFAYTAP